MKSRIFAIFGLCVCLLGLASFRNSTVIKDAGDWCPVTFSVTNSDGCSVIVNGQYLCATQGTPSAMDSFQGTITFSGSGCWKGVLNVGYAIPNGNGGWDVPTGANVGVYLIETNDCCAATDVGFVGGPDAPLNILDGISPTFLSQFQKDAGC